MNQAKKATKEYHNALYRRAELFEKGTWLEKSDDILLNLVREYFAEKKNIRVLDLGCGVGRNAIPVAHIVGPNGGSVTCIDFLDIAIEKLKENAQKHGVADSIDAHIRDLESYPIEKHYFDLIIAFSSLEHGVSDEESFFRVLESIKRGTKSSGINYLGITTSLQELDAETLEPLPANVEFKASFEEAKSTLKKIYQGWEIIRQEKSPYEEKYMKNGRMIIWKDDFLIFVAKKQ